MGTLLNRRRYMGGGSAPIPETRIVTTVYASSATSLIPIMASGKQSQFSAIEIDGVAQPSVDYHYVLGSKGNHTVKYTLIDNTTIANATFQNINTIKSISLPDSITSIGSLAFQATQIESINIGRNVSSIGSQALRGCTYLTSITVDSANETFDSRDNCNAIILTEQNTLMFGCNTSTVPQGITVLGERAFAQSGITSIVIPNTVSKIESYCFYSARDLASVTVLSTTPPLIANTIFSGVSSNLIIYVPSSSVESYKTASGWSSFADRIQAIPT